MVGLEALNLIITGASDGGTFNWRFVLEYALNLFILLGVLVYFLRTPVRKFVVQRRTKIGNEIDEAQRRIAEAKNKYGEYAQKLESIEDEVSLLKEAIREQGQAERREIIRQAEAASQNIKKEAIEAIELQMSRARREIQSKALAQVLLHAEGLIRQRLDKSDERRFIREFTASLELEGEKWDRSQR